MRSPAEIQRAHDVLLGVVLGDVPILVDDEDAQRLMKVSAGVLCWVLEHDHNPHFAQVLSGVEKAAQDLGFRLSHKREDELRP